MNKYYVDLYHGWEESKYGIDHAFILRDSEEESDDIGKLLADELDCDVDDDNFNYDYRSFELPEALVDRIRNDAHSGGFCFINKQFIARRFREWFDEMTEHDKNIRNIVIDSAEDATFDFTGPRMRNLRKSKLNRELCREKIITTLELIGLYDGYNGSNYDTESLKQLISTIEAMSDVKKEK